MFKCFNMTVLILSIAVWKKIAKCNNWNTRLICWLYSKSTILRSDNTSQITLFSRECFLRHYRGQLNSVKKTNKRKRNNLKMPSFWQYLTVQVVLTERKKRSLITIFYQLLKVTEKKAWNFRKWEGKSG